MVKAFDCGPKSLVSSQKSQVQIPPAASQGKRVFLYLLLPLGDQTMAERAKEVKTKMFAFFLNLVSIHSVTKPQIYWMMKLYNSSRAKSAEKLQAKIRVS